MISEEMLAVQREAEAELGDVTERIVDKGSSAGGADASTTADQPTGEKVVPNLLRAMSAAGNADLFTAPSKGGDEKGSQLDALLAKASQYSEFIRNSQDTATSSFYQHARKEMGIGDADGGKKKKQKKEAAAAEGTAAAAAAAAGQEKGEAEEELVWQPAALKGQLKDYQLEGLRWMATLYENGLSGILADEMGLGKTIQIISLLAYLHEKNVQGPFIIAAPLATLPNWIKEFKKWLPEVETLLYHGSKPEREAMRRMHMPLERSKKSKKNKGGSGEPAKRFPVIITSYEICIIDRRSLEKYQWQYLIVDEGQRVKNRNCRLIKELKSLPTQNRLLLSGTPIQNTLEEMWSLLNFVNPAIFDNLEIFQSWFGFSNIDGQKGNSTSASEIMENQKESSIVTKLHEILRPFLLRRLKKDVLIDMPPKKEIVLYTPMSMLQRDYYALATAGTLRDKLLSMGLSGGRECSQINLNMNLRKISNHPFLFGEPNDDAGQPICDSRPELLIAASGKFKVLDRMLVHLHKANAGHQVLIFSQMTETLNIMEDYLRFRQWKYCRIDGSVKLFDRQEQMDDFNTNKDIFVFMLSTRAGGLGINLQAADTVILFDSDWNPHQDAQAMDRAHRIGQKKPVAVYRLLTHGSVEIDMMEKQISKKKLERMAIQGGNFAKPGQRREASSFTVETLKSLLQDDVKLDERSEEANTDKLNGIGENELSLVMDRSRLFPGGKAQPCDIPNAGKMYDIIAEQEGGMFDKNFS